MSSCVSHHTSEERWLFQQMDQVTCYDVILDRKPNTSLDTPPFKGR